jgi:hypothetical protein
LAVKTSHGEQGLDVRHHVEDLRVGRVAAVRLALSVKEDLLEVPADVRGVEGCVQQQLLRSELRLGGGAERLIQQQRSGYLTALVTPVSWLGLK